jgi:hypothetical protein
MASLRKLIMESALREDDEAKQRGWKHIGFGTYEDPSGKRYRRDDGGSWKEIGSSDPKIPGPHPSRATQGIPHRKHSIAPAIHDKRPIERLRSAALYGGKKPHVSWDDDNYTLTWNSPGYEGDNDNTLSISFSTQNPKEYTIRATSKSGPSERDPKAPEETRFDRTIRGKGSPATAVKAADDLAQQMDDGDEDEI